MVAGVRYEIIAITKARFFGVTHVWRQRDVPLEWQAVRYLLPGKAEAYGLTYNGPDDFLDEQVLRGIQRDWHAQLANFVIDLPPFEECSNALQTISDTVFGDIS